MKVCAVIVTYNRLSLLIGCIDSLRNQSYPLDSIIVVNNDSTDGTKEWLERQTDIIVINQSNIGGAGGFHTGTKYAYEKGYDWVWLMDDDVEPTPNCLENLFVYNSQDIGIIQPLRIFNGKPVLFESKELNLSDFSVDLHSAFVTLDDISTPCYVAAIPFEGPLVKREVFTKIGFPNKDYFIFYDDTDFSLRTQIAGYKILLIPTAILQKKILPSTEKVSLSWKKCYDIRNYAFFNRVYGHNWKVRYLRSLKSSYHYIRYCYRNNNDMSLSISIKILKYTLKGMLKEMGKL